MASSNNQPSPCSAQSPCPTELEHVDVVSCTPCPVRLAEPEEENGETRDTSSTTSFSGLGTSVASGSDPNDLSPTLGDKPKSYFCQRCLNHRLEYPRKGHKPYCKYANCQCDECIMVEKRRQLNNKLSVRRLNPNVPRLMSGEKKVRDPTCARCSVHGQREALRGHKRTLCPFKECDCDRCKLVEERRMLMAKQIKLRRDQQKAKKAQLAVETIERAVRETIDLDLSPKKTLKTPLKLGEKKPRQQRQKPAKLCQQQSTLPDPTQLLKMRLEARQSTDANDQDENRQNGPPIMPLPIHPMLFRHLRTHNGLPSHPMPHLFPFPTFMPPHSLPYTLGNPVFTPPHLLPQTPSSAVPTPTSGSSSLPSPTTPPQLQQQANNLSPPLASFNSMLIGNNETSKPVQQPELSPLQQIKLLQQQCFESATGIGLRKNETPKAEEAKQKTKQMNEATSPPEPIDEIRLQKQHEELLAAMQKQLLIAQQQQQQQVHSPTNTTSSNFMIAPDILRNLSSNPGVSQQIDLRQMMLQQHQTMASINPPQLNGSDQVTLDSATFYKLVQMAMSAKQN